jgi:hypothetical protein
VFVFLPTVWLVGPSLIGSDPTSNVSVALLSYWFARQSQWVLAVSFCPAGEPTGIEFHSSISLLFPIQPEIPASRLLCLPPAFTLVSYSDYSSTLKMEAMCSSETSVYLQRTTRSYIPDDNTLHTLYIYIYIY